MISYHFIHRIYDGRKKTANIPFGPSICFFRSVMSTRLLFSWLGPQEGGFTSNLDGVVIIGFFNTCSLAATPPSPPRRRLPHLPPHLRSAVNRCLRKAKAGRISQPSPAVASGETKRVMALERFTTQTAVSCAPGSKQYVVFFVFLVFAVSETTTSTTTAVLPLYLNSSVQDQ